MKYKVGDKVKIKNDLIAYKRYGKSFFNETMEKYKGLVVSIVECSCKDVYKIDADNSEWVWTDDMFEPVNKISNKVIFRDKATILFLNGKKYVAKCDKEDTFDKEKGLLLCLAKSIGYGYKDIQKMIENAKEYN